MYLKDFNLCFVQIPNVYEKGVIEQLHGFVKKVKVKSEVEGEPDIDVEDPSLMIESVHPQRTCEKMGVWASRRVDLFSVVENTYDRLVYLYKVFYEADDDKRFHNFGEFVRYVYESKVSDTVDQRWYIHNLSNGDVDSSGFRQLELDEQSVDNVFIDGKGLDTFLSKVLGTEFVLEVPKQTHKTSDYYTSEIKSMVDEMYAKEIEFFKFKYPK